jgi:hypothetical protein
MPVGAVDDYENPWDVNTITAAGGNTSVYGENHKAIIIHEE